MCISSFWFPPNHPFLSFILVFNRDETISRETIKAHEWRHSDFNSPNIISGIDGLTLKGNDFNSELEDINIYENAGTWLGISKNGKFGLLTNIPSLNKLDETDYKSRGSLISDYLKNNLKPLDYLNEIKEKLKQYQGFNLILGFINNNNKDIWILSHHLNPLKKDESNIIIKNLDSEKIHCISNVPFGNEIIKTTKLGLNFEKVIKEIKDQSHLENNLLKIMGPDPNASPIQSKKDLSNHIFIPKLYKGLNQFYGTRTTTFIMLTKPNNQLIYNEYLWNHDENIAKQDLQAKIIWESYLME